MNNLLDKTIGEIVAEDYRTAEVFGNHGIDFCCKGNRSIQEACTKANIDQAKLTAEVEVILNKGETASYDYQSWPLDKLADHIEQKHHHYVEEKMPVLKQYLEKLCQVHGKSHPELFEITRLFTASAGELAMHMKKEEFILFPFVRKMERVKKNGEKITHAQFDTVESPVKMMMEEHETEGDRFQQISDLSNHYSLPDDACNTYRVTYAMLKEFEEDLHLHIHLENNILFPKSIALEKQLS
ncbi:MAG: iron-sulfur cluster repair di-iron protein [Imperialibacter sp.]